MKYELERTWVQFKSQLSDLLARTVLSTYGPHDGLPGRNLIYLYLCSTSTVPGPQKVFKCCLNKFS